MTQTSIVDFKVYRIDSNIFPHHSYAVCATYRNTGGYLKAESFVLIQTSDSEGVCIACKLSFPTNTQHLPIVIDEEFAAEEALRQAEVDYSIYMHDENFKLSVPHHWPQKQFIPVSERTLTSIWMFTPLKDHLSAIANATSCEALSKYLNALRVLPLISRTKLAL
jgi:hypothetical protein